MRKATKTIISFAVILIAGLNFIIPALAQDPFTAIAIGGLTGASGAGLFGSMAGMSGVNIGWGNNTVDEMDAIWNSLNPDHVYFSGSKHEATNIDEDIYDYIEVDIGDWLDAQSDFIVNMIQSYNVSDNDTGNITVDSYEGCPYNIQIQPQNSQATTGTVLNFALGDIKAVMTWTARNRADIDFYRNNVRLNGFSYVSANAGTWYLLLLKSGNNTQMKIEGPSGSWLSYTFAGGSTTNTSWTSGTVNSSVFDGWENARVKIPHSISGLSPDWTIPEFTDAINNLWLANQQGQIVIEDTDQPVPPPPVPVPTTPLGEVPFDDWVDLWGQGIYEQLENQSDALDFIGSNGTDAIEELESIDENIGALEEVAESIDTNIGVGNGILGGIRSLAQSAVGYLEGIAEHVGELVEEIVAGTETLIAGILNQIPQAFGVIFGPIKQASSIWHYVVEWITSIGAPFQFIWSMASGTSYYVILPVYASLAAAVVLAFFKRFGR